MIASPALKNPYLALMHSALEPPRSVKSRTFLQFITTYLE